MWPMCPVAWPTLFARCSHCRGPVTHKATPSNANPPLIEEARTDFCSCRQSSM